jgi:hypothetical protein
MTSSEGNLVRIEEILKLVEYIPIGGDIPSNGRFIGSTTIDSEFYFESVKRTATFRDIIRLVNSELLGIQMLWKKVLLFEQRYKQLREIGCSYPVEYLLFDFCLAALESDYVDAALYLAHSFHILGLNKSFNLLLSVILNEGLSRDQDVRRLLTLLAKWTEPRNADKYLESYGDGYRKRYNLYKEELRKLG